MRVAYALTFDFSLAHGLLQRMSERAEVLLEQGVDLELFVAVPQDADDRWVRRFPCPVTLVRGKHSATASWHLSDAIAAGSFDVCYVRYGLPYPGLVRLARSIPCVLEIHADDVAEARYRPPHYGLLVRLLRRQLLSRAAGAVFVDPDLAASPRFTRIRGPRSVITNGVRLRGDVRYGGTRRRREGPPRLLLAAGAAEPWQGIDKYLELAALCPQLEFHVAGPDLGGSLPANVIAHGQLAPEDFESLLDGVDVGVGNLALERINRPRASPLKVREYIRAGLPCLLAHDDPDLSADETVLDLGYGFEVSEGVAARVTGFAAQVVGVVISERNAAAVDLVTKEDARKRLLVGVARKRGRQ